MHFFQHLSGITNGRNIDHLERDSDSENSWQGDDADGETFSPSTFLW